MEESKWTFGLSSVRIAVGLAKKVGSTKQGLCGRSLLGQVCWLVLVVPLFKLSSGSPSFPLQSGPQRAGAGTWPGRHAQPPFTSVLRPAFSVSFVSSPIYPVVMLPLLQNPSPAMTPPRSNFDATIFPNHDASSFSDHHLHNVASPYQQSFAIRTSRPQRLNNSFGSAFYPQRQEYHLRRKTPNGTIDAGYDGSPSPFSHGPPPPKHLFQPRSAISTAFPLASPSIHHPRFTTEIDHHHSPSAVNKGFDDHLQARSRSSTWAYAGDAAPHHGAFPGNYYAFHQPEAQFNPYGQPEASGFPNLYQPVIRAHEYNVRAFCPPPVVMNESLPFGQPASHMPWNFHAQSGVLPRHVQQQGPRHFQHHAVHGIARPSSFSHVVEAEPHGHTGNDLGMPIQSHTRTAHMSNPQGFREKVVLQAHKVYIDLLACTQAIRKPNATKSAAGNTTSPRLLVYPKPPKPSLRISEAALGHEFAPFRPPQENEHYQGYSSRRHSAHNFYGSSNSYLPMGNTTPFTAAKSTLEVLSNLCEQSSWGWIDGMMLGGCLHYGLEQYQEALEWFSRILALDSSDVEAITNKAATLYCLNRQDEAEKHWIRAVEVQPSYLEAVEHLVGLLYKKRSKEAVDIIDHVQRALRISSVQDQRHGPQSQVAKTPGFASSGYALPAKENGRILALIHAKGTMLYSLKEINRASEAFEEAVLISVGRRMTGIQDLVRQIQTALSPNEGFASNGQVGYNTRPLLLPPERARHTAQLVFGGTGALPGLQHVPEGSTKRAAVQTTSNSLLSLAKIFQDSLSTGQGAPNILRRPSGVEDILALYYLSLSLQESPSTANNVGILLAGVQQATSNPPRPNMDALSHPGIPGIVPGSGLALALAYYHYGLRLDPKHVHLHTNLGSLLKDIGQLDLAIQMYEQAVSCDGTFDIALTNLANAVKDRGRINDAISYYKRAVNSNPDFAEAVCGLSTALNSVCDWRGRGGVILKGGKYDRWHVDDDGQLIDARATGHDDGLVSRVIRTINRQLSEASHWGRGVLDDNRIAALAQQIQDLGLGAAHEVQQDLAKWKNQRWEGARVRNGIRISCSTLRLPWLPSTVYPPPPPPNPHLNIGYVSSDFNNHPLAHLMQSVFGFHDPQRVRAFCYATTASDRSVHRQQIEREAPVFRDASSWPADRLVEQIVSDEIHVLVNLNGYTRGARNEVFAARPAPVQMSFMGFAGTLGAEWCDYILADSTAIPPETLRPWRGNSKVTDVFQDETEGEGEDWMYSENIIFCRDTFFCCDHAQSCDAGERSITWEQEQQRRWKMRKEIFPALADDTIIMGNFNQLYKVPKAVIWLLRFPELGEANLRRTAKEWAGEEVASRLLFTDVAPKSQHISRARVCDLFLDTPECNAHTTAADVLWSSTPLLTLPRYPYKMCSRMAASILKGALPKSDEGRQAAAELIAGDEKEYEQRAVKLANQLSYTISASGYGQGEGRLAEIRKLLWESKWHCGLFNTRRWVDDVETAYEEAWRRWVAGEGGDIHL
ncbi:hypothetical protein FGSG_01916 [Fusarium graminearum PH-1]|uniref:hypothetical protein n=1 Tax=Gibberella zeae (strain ATCC MYA-4620 / CBS 123657 / FGSC 9075 / NRRL 31084 / PH-1) TaxID=229533 RepID=UPI00021F18C0|nr:hypothetical protein FGSG_01916 [Fusarium graminearum PH-1]ESU07281.1 hypothetical protein FGSG_01916 [Fusarium graminearum PH-1]|eukprot:XP_011317766.1 hypothetical protein FGSG_01916 [Fusarium graminearum PH-1]